SFAFVYDSTTTTIPQVAIRVTDTDPAPRSFNLALVVLNSSTGKFNLARLDSHLNQPTSLSNISVDGNLLTKLTAPELQLFTDLTAKSRGGIQLPADSITGVEVAGTLPIGYINITGIEGLAFGILATANGTPVTVTNPLGQGTSLWNLLGSHAV